MTFEKLSLKQLKVLKWWNEKHIADKYDAIVCDGAVRSGKTTVMIMSFILWAMDSFSDATFGICGKTVRSAERNIIMPLQQIADMTAEYELSYTRSISLLSVSCGERKNYFYVFGGKDESSYQLIQGITLSGVFFDEVALMPESFVNQAIARTLSVSNRRLWFNCNPESPNHWFYLNWVKEEERGKKNAVHLHFTMRDNPILTDKDIAKAEKMYSGVFYNRYILGEWVVADGLVYPMFDKTLQVVPTVKRKYERFYVSIDYGTLNPCVFSLWGQLDGIHYLVKEYYYSGRGNNAQKTDDEYYQELVKFTEDYKIEQIIIDPSAASFMTLINRKGQFATRKADNAVLDGIRETASALKMGLLKFNDCCIKSIAEFGLYSWDTKVNGEDRPIKENDHFCDSMRYYVKTLKIAQPKWESWV